MNYSSYCSPSLVAVGRVRSLLLFGLITALAGHAWADNASWTGIDAYNNPGWNNPNNWTNNTVPANPLPFTDYATSDGAVVFDASWSGSADSLINTPWTIGRLVFTNANTYVLSGSDLTLAQAQNSGSFGVIDLYGTANITISNRLLIPVATNNPTTNIRHQFYVYNGGTLNLYGDIVKTGEGPGQISFRGGSGEINVYGAVKWDTNTVFKTDTSTNTFYNSGNTWTQMNLSVGTVRLGVENALPVNSGLDFNQNSGGASFLRMNDFNQTLAFLRSSTIGNGSNTQIVDTATSSLLTINDNGGSNVFGGSIVGGGSLWKTGNGTLVLLTNNSTYSGGTWIQNGTLSLGNGTTGGNITGYITNNATLVVNKSDAVTLPNPISGSGQLVKLGSGTLTLPATNTYSGATTISNGTVLVNGQLAGPVNLYGGALGGNGSLVGPVTLYSNAQVQTALAPTPATLTFQNNLTLNPGAYATYKFGGPTTVGNGANDLLDVKGNLALNNNPLVLVPEGPLAVGNTYVIATAGALSGSFGAVTNPTRYTFTTASSGNQATLTVSGGARSSLVWQGTNANWDLTTSNWLSGAARDKFYQSDAALFNDTATNRTVSFSTAVYPESVTVNSTNTFIFAGSGKLSGAASLLKTNSGLLVVSNANDFTGPVYIQGGMFKLGNATALGATNGGTFITNGATLDTAGFALYNPGELITIAGTGLNNTGAVINSTADQNNTLRYLALAGDAAVGTWTNRWDVRGPGGNSSFSGGLFLNGFTLTKLGTNKMGLADLMITNAGNLRVASGTLALTRSAVEGPGYIDIGTNLLQIENSGTGYVTKPLIVSGGTLQLVGNPFTLGSPITNNGLTVDIPSGLTLTLTNVMTGTGAVAKAGAGLLLLQQPDLGTGPLTINGGTVQLDAGSGLPNVPTITLGNGTTLDVTLQGSLVLASGQKLTGSGSIAGDLTAGPGTVVVPGSSAGTLNVNGNATFNNASFQFELGADPFDSTKSDQIAVIGMLNLAGINTIRVTPTASLSTTYPYTLFQGYLGSGSAANLNVTTDSRYQFTVLDPTTTLGQIQVQVSGSGTAADLVWRGGDAANPTAWDLKSTPNWLNGATPDKFFSGDNLTFGDSALNNVATLAGDLAPASITFINNALNYSFAGPGAIVSGSFTNRGSRLLTVANSAANTFGAFDVESGTVILANGGADTFSSDFIVNGGTLGLGNNGALAFATVPTLNNGALIVSNATANTFPGGVTVNGGAALFANAGANHFGIGLTLNGGTLTLANAFANNLGSLATVSSTLQFNQPVDATASGAVSGYGTLLKQGTNVLTLSGNNNAFSGQVDVRNGVLRSGAANALGAGTVSVANGATLDINGQDCRSASSITVQGAGLGGTGALRNNGADQQNAAKNVVLSGDATFGGTGRFDVRGPGGNGSFSGILDLAGFALTKVGANKISLVDTYLPNSGTINVTSGILSATRSFITNSGPIILNASVFQFENNTTGYVSKPFVTDRGTLQLVGNSFGLASPVTNIGGVTVDVASGQTFTLSNIISGAGTLTKTNTGTLVLNTPNTFTGDVYLRAGVLQLANSLALNTNKGVWITNTTGATGGNGATLDLTSNVVAPSSLALAAYTTFSPDIRGTLRAAAGSNEWSGPITLYGDGRFGLQADAAGSCLTVSGPINGPTTGPNAVVFVRGANGVGLITGPVNFNGQLAKTDTGTWQINSANNVWAATQISVGTLRLGADNALCVLAPLTIGQNDTQSPTLDLNGHNQTVPALVNNGTGGPRRIANDSSTADAVFTFAGTNVSTFAGQFLDNLTTNGTRKLSLQVTAGTLYLNGVNSNTGPTVVQNSGLLGGNGTLFSAVTVQNGGTLGAGTAAIGRLAISNSVVFSATATNLMKVNLAPATNDIIVGASSIQFGGTLVVTNVGTVDLTNGATFRLYSANSYSGAFDKLVPATPGPGLAWNTTNLTVNGTLSVVPGVPSIPTNITFQVSGNALQLSWPSEYLGWRLQGQTNTLGVGLSSTWYDVPGSSTSTSVSLPINPANGAAFYRLVAP